MNGEMVSKQAFYCVFEFDVELAESLNIFVAEAGSVKDTMTIEKVDVEPAIYTPCPRSMRVPMPS